VIGDISNVGRGRKKGGSNGKATAFQHSPSFMLFMWLRGSGEFVAGDDSHMEMSISSVVIAANVTADREA